MSSLSCKAISIIAIAASSALMSSPSLAQQRRPPQEAKEPAKPATPSYKELRLESFEDELAGLLQRRGDTAVDATMLEVQIDLRLLARSLASSLADKLDAKPEQAAAFLRMEQVLRAGQAIAANTKPLTALGPAQSAALKQLHDLTYKPLDTSSVAAIDAIAKDVAGALVAISPAAPQVPMRPAQVINPNPTTTTSDNSLASLRTMVQRANVMPGLRRQLLGLADAATTATTAGDAAETRALTGALTDAVDLASGLATNTAVDNATRQEVETQLAEGLALFVDTRTRDIGRRRLKTLQPYRQTLVRVGKIKENPDANRLGKLFVWAQENADEGSKALVAVEAYNRVVAEYESRPAATSLPPNVKRSADAMRKHFAQARATFMDDARALGEGGIMAPQPKQLEDDVAEMAKALDMIGLVESTPKSVDVLLAYKPLPTTALEKRTIAALLGVMGEGKMPQPDAEATVKAINGLANAATRIGGTLNDTLAPTVAEAWGSSAMAAWDKKLRAMITTQASNVAANGVIDDVAVARLTLAADICEVLRNAKDIDDAIVKSGALSRWADWGLSTAALEAIVKPYRDATGTAVLGVINDAASDADQWRKIHRKYRPVVAYIQRMSEYAPACAALPDDAAGGAIAQLATPFDGQRFGDVRRVAAALSIWSAAEQAADLSTAEAAAGIVARLLPTP